jgi:hypothetical protein
MGCYEFRRNLMCGPEIRTPVTAYMSWSTDICRSNIRLQKYFAKAYLVFLALWLAQKHDLESGAKQSHQLAYLITACSSEEYRE